MKTLLCECADDCNLYEHCYHKKPHYEKNSTFRACYFIPCLLMKMTWGKLAYCVEVTNDDMFTNDIERILDI